MKKLKTLLSRICHVRGLKYVVVAVLGLVLVCFVDDNSMWKHMKNQQYINELQDEITRYNRQYRHDQAQIHLLDSDPKTIEKIARERYFMKTDDEDIFVLSDDPHQEEAIIDETAE